MKIEKIISGGQTGADRAAFDFALENGFEMGGFVPRGRRAEDGAIGEKYPNLTETATRNYAERTELNIINSDATLILSHGPLSKGSRLTQKLAKRHGKPCLHIDFTELDIGQAVDKTRAWLALFEGSRLNIAGPRASTDAAIYEKAKLFLRALMVHCLLFGGRNVQILIRHNEQ